VQGNVGSGALRVPGMRPAITYPCKIRSDITGLRGFSEGFEKARDPRIAAVVRGSYLTQIGAKWISDIGIFYSSMHDISRARPSLR